MSEYTIRTFNDFYEMIEMKHAATGSAVTLCPERGGIVTGCTLENRELLYLDEATFRDPAANIRGGIPVLFPICGPLIDGRYEWEGREYEMKQHGIARLLPWEVAGTNTDGEASVTLRLQSSPATMEIYPFAFEIEFTYVLKNAALHIRQTYKNTGDGRMPFYAGFHPYFKTEAGPVRYRSDATRLMDMNDLTEKPDTGIFDAGQLREAVVLLDSRSGAVSFQPTGPYSVVMEYSPAFRYLVLWSVAGKPFVCVEPWMARPHEMHRKRELKYVDPNGRLQAELTIRCKED